LRVRRISRADHEQQIYPVRDALDGVLAVLRRVTDVVPARQFQLREAPSQSLDDFARVIFAERRLRQNDAFFTRVQV
jgi:hypothetical protein